MRLLELKLQTPISNLIIFQKAILNGQTQTTWTNHFAEFLSHICFF